MMMPQINDQEVVYFDPRECSDMHCITKNHLLYMFVCFCLFVCFFSLFYFILIFFGFVTCCVPVKYVSLTAVKVLGGKRDQCLLDFKCFHGVLYLSF